MGSRFWLISCTIIKAYVPSYEADRAYVCVFLVSGGLLYSRKDPVSYVSVFVHLSLLLCQRLMKVGGNLVIKDANGTEDWAGL